MKHQMRRNFERDLEDSTMFMKEVLLVVWRLNPVGIAVHSCNQSIGCITENTPGNQKAAIITEIVSAIEIVSIDVFEKNFSDLISEVCKGVVSEVVRGAVLEYPQVEPFLIDRLGSDGELATQPFVRMSLSAISRQRGHYQQLHGFYLQLVEYLPRYSSIMNRGEWFSGVMGFAAGFFGGQAGVAGVEVWENWRNSNDQDFCQKFGNAFDQFMQACFQYVGKGEEALLVVFERLIDEIKRIHHIIFDSYDELAEAGWNIEPLYKRYRTLEEPLDDEAKQLFELALVNLEENRSVHFRTIANIRSMMDLDSDPSASRAVHHGSVSDTLHVKGQAQLTLETVHTIIGEFYSEEFCVAGKIPPKKLSGAVGSYAPQVGYEDILLLFDNTVFGSAKVGLLITPQSIHWRNSFEGARFLHFSQIETVSLDESTSILKEAEIKLNEEIIQVGGTTVYIRNLFARYILRIIEAVKPR